MRGVDWGRNARPLMKSFFSFLDKIAYWLAAICVGGMLTCVTIQVIARHTSLSVNWTTELSQYFFLWSTTFASYIAARRGKLIGVEMIQRKMPSPIRKLMRFISWGSAAFFYGLVVYFCFGQLPRLLVQKTPMLKWSMGMIYIIMMVGLSMLTVYCLWLAFQAFSSDTDSAGTGSGGSAADSKGVR